MGTEASRILIADGDPEARQLASSALRQAGYEVWEVASADEALKAVREDRPALVILDVALPGMSGYDVCRTLREEYGEALPIVLVSGPPTRSFGRLARALVGTDDYVVRAVSPQEMLSIIGGR